MNKHSFKKIDFILLGLILLVATIMRSYAISAPLADFHSWRQADTAAVARNFERNGFDLLHPTYDDLTNLQSGMDNPQGYRFVEFPVYNALFAFLHSVAPIVSLETWGRIVSVFFSLICIASLYYLALMETGRPTALFTGITYAIMPFFVYFSRVILPDTPAIACAIAALALLHMFTTTQSKNGKVLFFMFSCMLFSVSLLMKPTTIFYALPIFVLLSKNINMHFQKNCIFYFISF